MEHGWGSATAEAEAPTVPMLPSHSEVIAAVRLRAVPDGRIATGPRAGLVTGFFRPWRRRPAARAHAARMTLRDRREIAQMRARQDEQDARHDQLARELEALRTGLHAAVADLGVALPPPGRHLALVPAAPAEGRARN